MIVVAIIGILAAIALPAYRDYTEKAEAGVLLSEASSLKTCVAEALQTGVGSVGDCKAGTTATATGTKITATKNSKTIELDTADNGSTWTCTSKGFTVTVTNCTKGT